MLADATGRIEVSGEASSIEEAGDERPDVWLVSDTDQLPALVAGLHTALQQAVVVIGDATPAINALAGADLSGLAVVQADVSPAELQAAVLAAAQGMLVMPYRAGRDAITVTAVAPAQDAPLEQPLTQRELEVLERVSRGLPSKMIAQQLDVAESTIKFHLSSIYSKLGVATRTEAVSKAARLGLITL